MANFRCHLCDRKYKWASSLACHVRAAHRSISLECPVCKKTFRDPSNLRTHEIGHGETKRHRCAYCKSGFVRRDHYESHVLRCEARVKRHSGQIAS